MTPYRVIGNCCQKLLQHNSAFLSGNQYCRVNPAINFKVAQEKISIPFGSCLRIPQHLALSGAWQELVHQSTWYHLLPGNPVMWPGRWIAGNFLQLAKSWRTPKASEISIKSYPMLLRSQHSSIVDAVYRINCFAKQSIFHLYVLYFSTLLYSTLLKTQFHD